ncbi:MAG: maleylacetoacetate isomerase [Undibacterium sp.]|nr:maleylacetoacetate isomerase [Undibacterium sp.]
MKLYGYFRSSASYRVRIALNLKGLDAEHVPVHLVNNGGEQLSENFRALNPEALVPALMDIDAGQQIVLSQSLAIMEYLEEKYPTPALLPDNAADRAHVRSLGLSIACEIHPLNNLRVLKYLTTTLGLSDEQKNAWYQHWCISGLAALEQRLASDKRTGDFCFGHAPTLADCCLVPQIFNAQRFNCDLSGMPTLMRVNQRCLEMDAFIKAMPMNQPDAA